MFFLSHHSGRLEFQDFKNNYITDIMEQDRKKEAERVIGLNGVQKDINMVSKLFDLSPDLVEKEGHLYRWDSIEVNDKLNLCYCWKSFSEDEQVCSLDYRIMVKIANICMISTNEAENSIIHNYAKDFLDILEYLIN